MALKIHKPVTSSKRGAVSVDRRGIYKGKPKKSLLGVLQSRGGGRNNLGRITVRHRCRGAKKRYRIVDFNRNISLKAVVERIEYDPNRSAYIACIKYSDGVFAYIIAPEGLSIGDEVESSETAEIKTGNCLSLKNIPVGTVIHNVEMRPFKGGQLARSAGSCAVLVNKSLGKVSVKLNSGVQRIVDANCKATIGRVSNADKKNIKLGKAGASFWLGKRPTVRGVAMNPVDHPHGGGEGKTSGGRHPVTPWGKPTKGYKTRNCKRTDAFVKRPQRGGGK